MGNELDRISKVLFGDVQLQIESVSTNELVVLFPEGLIDEDVVGELILEHNNNRVLLVKSDFRVTIIPIYSFLFWKNLEISAREGVGAFLRAKNGMVYDNCAATDHITDLDFCGYINNSKHFFFYCPHNTTNILKKLQVW